MRADTLAAKLKVSRFFLILLSSIFTFFISHPVFSAVHHSGTTIGTAAVDASGGAKWEKNRMCCWA